MSENKDTIKLPGELKMPLRYHQARRMATLARLSPDWHVSSAWDMPIRLHLWFDGQLVLSAWRISGKWQAGPSLALESLKASGKLAGVVSDMARAKKRGVGVIFHVADELAFLPANDEEVAKLPSAHVAAILRDDPERVVLEKLSEDQACRLLQLSSGSHTAIRLNTGSIQIALREVMALRASFPVRCAVTAAAVQQLAVLPLIYSTPEGVPTDSTKVFLYHYLRYTATFVVGADGELLAMANMPHGSRTYDATARQKLATLLASVGVSESTSIFIVLLDAGGAGIDALTKELENLFDQYPNTKMGLLHKSVINEKLHIDADFAPEFLIDDLPAVNRAFSGLADEEKCYSGNVFSRVANAATENYFRQDLVNGIAFPNRAEIFAVVAAKCVWIAWVGVVCALLWICYYTFQAINSPAWKLPESQATEASARVEELRRAKSAYAAWKKVLTPRSQAWASMELVARLIPDNHKVTLSAVEIRSEFLVDQNTENTEASSQKAGMKRIFTLSGQGDKSEVEGLLTPVFVRKVFTETSQLPGAALLSPDISDVQSRLETFLGKNANSVNFTLTITQVIPAKSDVAIPTRAASISDKLVL